MNECPYRRGGCGTSRWRRKNHRRGRDDALMMTVLCAGEIGSCWSVGGYVEGSLSVPATCGI
ncbi:hypothetical protein KCP78_08645 [Salmonella enterica subsp. enterica]|nr:hypothetical protein KCP78_08645 [Salmonella enterica subsp. enterica]